MKPAGAYKDHVVLGLNSDSELILEGVRKALHLHESLIHGYTPPDSIQDEEDGMARQSPETTLKFARNRARVTDTLKAIPGFLFNEYKLPRDNGLDVGSGSTGYMRNTLLADQIKHHGWVEMDANPHAVGMNRELHPNSRIVTGSYHRLMEMGLREKLDIVTGLSSLDATAFLDNAVDQMAKSLTPGGWFLHIQDVRPGRTSVIQALRHDGLTFPFKMESADASGENIMCFEARGERVSVVELFRRRMAVALEKTPSLDPVLNDWMVARRPAKKPSLSTTYYMNAVLEHSFYEQPVEEAFAVVTLAQKR